MKVKSISINNYKGFIGCNLTFHPKMNVLIGNNASGKTTLLEAIAKTLFKLTSSFVRSSGENLVLKNSDVNYSASSCFIEAILHDFYPYPNEIISIIHTQPIENEVATRVRNGNQSLSEFSVWLNTLIRSTSTTIPIVKYYPANRGAINYSQSPIPLENFTISQLEPWSKISQNAISFGRFFTWFLENETNELLMQRDAKDFSAQNTSLKNVRLAMSKAFEFMGYENIVIKTQQNKRGANSKFVPTLVLENTKTKKVESIDSKSDGEKTIITLIADIAYNLSLGKDFLKDEEFLNSPGIVIIDEIETHLHPNWQRKIIPLLVDVFPNIQFFIATHSPQVISSVKSESVFDMESFQVRKLPLKTKGEDSNSLLKYVFKGTDRPEEYDKLIKKFEKLIEEKAEYNTIESVISEIEQLENDDQASDIDILIDDLKLQFSAYKFEKENEEN